MKNTLLLLALASFLFTACNKDDDMEPSVEAPETYTFERNGESTVAFSGQTTRILMGEELISTMKDFSTTEEVLLQMYRNETESGGDADPFSDPDLNASDKSIRSKTAASADYFASNTVEANEIKTDFELWISSQVDEVFPNENTAAAPGIPGQIADGSSTRYVNALGLEYDQMVAKSLLGALMTDQALNNYLSVSVLDAGSNREDNNSEVLADGKDYTVMEHKWDEAYGYVYGTSDNPADPNPTIGQDDNFLNKYIGRVENDDDFSGIAEEIFNAFKLGRAAIVAEDYELRDEQADIIREAISRVIAIRAVYYLQSGKNAINANDMGAAFHDLSEGYGFIYSLRFTRNTATDQPYFDKTEVDGFINSLLGDGNNGLWDVETATLDAISNAIAEKFDFTVAQAAS